MFILLGLFVPCDFLIVSMCVCRVCVLTSSSAIADKPRCRVGQFWVGGHRWWVMTWSDNASNVVGARKRKALIFYTINPLLYEKRSLCVFWAPLWGLGSIVRCSSYLTLIGKPVVDFLLVIIENFFSRCYGSGATSEYRLEVAVFEGGGSLWPTISGRRGRPLPTNLRVRKLGWSSLIWYKNVGRTFVCIVTIHACDGQTDGRTALRSPRPGCIQCSAVKIHAYKMIETDVIWLHVNTCQTDAVKQVTSFTYNVIIILFDSRLLYGRRGGSIGGTRGTSPKFTILGREVTKVHTSTFPSSSPDYTHECTLAVIILATFMPGTVAGLSYM